MSLIKNKIRTIEDYPKQGIKYRDITTLLKDPDGLQQVIVQLVEHFQPQINQIDVVAGVEARGFVLGGALAFALAKGFVPIRKQGKLPAKVQAASYQLEYGTDCLEIHEDAVWPGCRVLLVDDLLATAGTALAAASLVERLHGLVHEMAFIVNLPQLGGQQKLQGQGYRFIALTEFSGD